jgi:hypothetical protein
LPAVFRQRDRQPGGDSPASINALEALTRDPVLTAAFCEPQGIDYHSRKPGVAQTTFTYADRIIQTR